MKKILLIIVVLSYFNGIIAQKKPAKNQMPNQKQMEDLQKMVDEQMKNLTTEQKAEMEKMTGGKMPNLKDVAKQAKNAQEIGGSFEELLVPKKDVKRIALIDKQKLNNGNISQYLLITHNKILSSFDEKSKTALSKVLQEANKSSNKALTLSSLALYCWLKKEYYMAVLIMGEALLANSTNVLDQNNYAAFLLMTGFEEYAIPILEKLERESLQSATIKNNLGQAWMGLGDTDRAIQKFNSCLAINVSHSQANNSMSYIEEAKGNIEKAKKYLEQSIKESPTKEKLDRLEYGLKGGGGSVSFSTSKNFKLPYKDDGLHLENLVMPDYPMSSEEAIGLDPVWESHQKNIEIKTQAFDAKMQSMEASIKNEMLGYAQNGLNLIPLCNEQMADKLKKLHDEFGEKYVLIENSIKNKSEEIGAAYTEHKQAINDADKWHYDAMGKVSNHGAIDGIEKEYCGRKNKAHTALMKTVNPIYKEFTQSFITEYKVYANEYLNLAMYCASPVQFEGIKLNCQRTLLNIMKGICAIEYDCNGKSTYKPVKLPEFENMECNFSQKIGYGPVSISISCTKFDLEISTKLPGTEVGATYTYSKTFGELTRSAEFTLSAGLEADMSLISNNKKFTDKLEVGAGAEIGFIMEVDKSGNKDYGIKSKVEVKGGQKGKGASIAAAEGRYMIEAGGSIEVKSLLGNASATSKSIFR